MIPDSPVGATATACKGYVVPVGIVEYRVHCNGCADAAALRGRVAELTTELESHANQEAAWKLQVDALREQLGEANTELGAYRHGYTTWTNDKGETEPSARTFCAMWSGLLSKCADYRALEADLRVRLATAEARATTRTPPGGTTP